MTPGSATRRRARAISTVDSVPPESQSPTIRMAPWVVSEGSDAAATSAARWPSRGKAYPITAAPVGSLQAADATVRTRNATGRCDRMRWG